MRWNGYAEIFIQNGDRLTYIGTVWVQGLNVGSIARILNRRYTIIRVLSRRQYGPDSFEVKEII